MMQLNPKWQPPAWQIPKLPDSPEDYVRSYAEIVQWAKGLVAVWAVTRGLALEIFTLVQPEDKFFEQEQYEAEIAFFDRWGDAPVRFHVYRDRESLLEQVGGAEPALVAA